MVMFKRSSVRKRVIPLATTASIAVASLVLACQSAPAQGMRATMSVQTPADRPEQPGEAAFLSENQFAMKKMMADMAVKPTGDVDRDFVAMMVPHHQGAVDMALTELRYGHNEQLRGLAQEIVANQQREIGTMRRAIGEPSSSSAASPAPETTGQPMPRPATNMPGGSISDTSTK
jgi:uncharacterized protein (DUF305 family)